MVETVLLEGEFRKYVTKKGEAEAKYPLKDSFIGRWGNTPCVIRKYLNDGNSDAKFKQRELDALITKGNIHENFIRYFGQTSASKDIRYLYI